MASEDSVENDLLRHASLLAAHVHRVRQPHDVRQSLRARVFSCFQEIDDPKKSRVVIAAGGHSHAPRQERRDAGHDPLPRDDREHKDIRIARFRADPACVKVVLGQLEKLAPRAVLVDEELPLDVVAEGPSGVRLDGDMDTAFSFDEPRSKPEPSLCARQAFLLIVCTARIVTAHTSTVTLVPADSHQRSQHIARFCNGQVTNVNRYSYGRRLPGLSFSASRPKPLTPPRNLPAPGRRQPLYVVFRLSRGLCFW